MSSAQCTARRRVRRFYPCQWRRNSSQKRPDDNEIHVRDCLYFVIDDYCKIAREYCEVEKRLQRAGMQLGNSLTKPLDVIRDSRIGVLQLTNSTPSGSYTNIPRQYIHWLCSNAAVQGTACNICTTCKGRTRCCAVHNTSSVHSVGSAVAPNASTCNTEHWSRPISCSKQHRRPASSRALTSINTPPRQVAPRETEGDEG